jgi:hypothetical protein
MLVSYPYVLAGAACLGLAAANVFRAAVTGIAVAAVGAAAVAGSEPIGPDFEHRGGKRGTPARPVQRRERADNPALRQSSSAVLPMRFGRPLRTFDQSQPE